MPSKLNERDGCVNGAKVKEKGFSGTLNRMLSNLAGHGIRECCGWEEGLLRKLRRPILFLLCYFLSSTELADRQAAGRPKPHAQSTVSAVPRSKANRQLP